jgi:membrane-bound lytic murein transglycosylase D
LKITAEPAKYGIDINRLNYEPEFKFDIIEIEQPSNLNAVAQAIGVGVSEIRELNPELLYDITPPDRKLYRLRVPVGSSKNFATNFAKLPNEVKQPSLDYIVKKDETIVSIAEKFDVSIDNLVSLNSLSTNYIAIPFNSHLRIPIGGKTYLQSNLVAVNNKLVPKAELLSTDKNFYVVITSESIYDIAEKNKINPADIRN